jgi:hypothetical protein
MSLCGGEGSTDEPSQEEFSDGWLIDSFGKELFKFACTWDLYCGWWMADNGW